MKMFLLRFFFNLALFLSLFGNVTASLPPQGKNPYPRDPNIPKVLYRAEFRTPEDIHKDKLWLEEENSACFGYLYFLKAKYDPVKMQLIRSSQGYRFPHSNKKFSIDVREFLPTVSSHRTLPLQFALKISKGIRIPIYIYHIDTKRNDFVDMRHSKVGKIDGVHPFPEENEYLINSFVEWYEVVGWDKLDTATGRTIYYPNPLYKGKLKTDRQGNLIG